MLMNYINGLKDCVHGFHLAFQPGARRFIIIPLTVNIVLFSSAIYFIKSYLDSWLNRLLPGWLSWLDWLIWPIFAFTILLITFYCFTLVMNLLAAPFNSLLAEHIETRLSNKPVTAENEIKILSLDFLNLSLRSIGAEIHKMIYFIFWLIPLVIITIIPGINVIAPFCWFIYAAWSLTIEYTDYSLSNHGMLFSEVRQYNQENRMRSLGLGTGIFLLTSIPILNFVAMPVAVAGATHLTYKLQEN